LLRSGNGIKERGKHFIINKKIINPYRPKMNSNKMLVGDQTDNFRQEKSLEQKLKMDRLEVDELAEGNSPKNKSLTGPENRYDSHGIERLVD